ncbi:MAG: acetamidase [Clostridiaceae bacterium]|nr:acetamidase [Clostridiaceae bacterium]
MQRIEKYTYTFSKDNEPVATAKPGEILLFKTLDCFCEQIENESQLVAEIDLSHANPATGPVFVEGAEPGDVLVVDICNIDVADKGISCTFSDTGPLYESIEPRTREIPIEDGYAKFNDITWPINPMIGVIGTAPAEDDIACGYTGSHGGNMDSNKIAAGTRVYLPVRVPGALLQMGDLHATMGDGELSGTGVEISGEVTVKISLIKDFELNWPVTELKDRWYVNATGANYEESLILASKELARLMTPVYGWDASDILIYFSVQGFVEVNQGVKPIHDDMVNLRVGIPKTYGKTPLIK